MDKDLTITPEQLAKAMDADYQKLVHLVSRAVTGAPDGAVICGGEELVRDAMARFRQKAYEKAIQLRTQAAQPGPGADTSGDILTPQVVTEISIAGRPRRLSKEHRH